LENKVSDITDARCNHEVHSTTLSKYKELLYDADHSSVSSN